MVDNIFEKKNKIETLEKENEILKEKRNESEHVWKYGFRINYYDKSKDTTVRTKKILKTQDIPFLFKIRHNKKYVNIIINLFIIEKLFSSKIQIVRTKR